jgi:hypothetical protein
MIGRWWQRSHCSHHRRDDGNAGKPYLSRLFPRSHLFPTHTPKVGVETQTGFRAWFS